MTRGLHLAKTLEARVAYLEQRLAEAEGRKGAKGGGAVAGGVDRLDRVEAALLQIATRVDEIETRLQVGGRGRGGAAGPAGSIVVTLLNGFRPFCASADVGMSSLVRRATTRIPSRPWRRCWRPRVPWRSRRPQGGADVILRHTRDVCGPALRRPDSTDVKNPITLPKAPQCAL